ncbi:hypothetical protein [Ruegeria sp. HKCCD6109]|uniref:hypothetical protein n=1 Tax=Ruegeria sp. HKCCD6109 TaxID=2683017 RepID=UPI00149107F7|nr:hypothetical protein [Ruegeria sp. HKCCD6109]NOD65737.1 hypothetical protein [Ruegeria sp. HKCCD6109]
MPLVEFVGQSVQDSGNIAINPGRLVNCYRELVVGQGRSQYVLQSVLGMDLLSDLGAATVRAMGIGNSKNWVAGDGKLFEAAGDGTLTQRAVVADDAVTTIEGNEGDVTVVSGTAYYLWNGSTLSQPTTKTFTDVLSHFYIGGYTVILEDGGKRFQWSAIGDASSLDALDFASADQVDGNLVRGFEVQGQAVLMSERHSELWAVTAATDSAEVFQFTTSWNRGLKAHNLAVKFDDSLFWVGDDNNVYVGFGPGAVDVTTPAVNTSLEQNTATHCFYYEDRGHKFCVLRFSDRAAWVYDVKMQEWHERAEGAGDGAWRAVASIKGDTWQVGNTVGEIYSLSNTNKDLNGLLRRTATSRPVYTGDKFRVVKLELSARVGENTLSEATDFGLDAGEGDILDAGGGEGLKLDAIPAGERAATVNLFVSRDGGRTWTDAKPRSLGLAGDYDQRTVWRALGQAHQFAVRVQVSEPADYQINTTAVLEVA